ncbi:MAG: lipoate--protein ligase [Clostridia bacterium]
MKLKLYLNTGLNVYENIAIEKTLFDNCDNDSVIIYLWANENTVVIGKNQNIYSEVNLNALLEDNGAPSRRFTGGGAVYHDFHNLNFTFIAPNKIYNESLQAEIILSAVKMFGVKAEKNGRNDLTTEGRKFSGNAFLHTLSKGMHHGTLLINTDTNKMMKYLNVDKEKLSAKGVKSVQSRVVNLSEIANINRENMSEAILLSAEKAYGLKSELITKSDVNKDVVDGYIKFLSSKEWLYNKVVDFDKKVKARFSWGGAEVAYKCSDGIIKNAVVYTDSIDCEAYCDINELFIGKSIEQLRNSLVKNPEIADILQMVIEDMEI